MFKQAVDLSMSDWTAPQLATSALFFVGATFCIFVIALSRKTESAHVAKLNELLRFVYGCFLKPHDRCRKDQKAALESFYKTQASIYDTTRATLLKGREDMLGLVAAQIRWRIKTGAISSKPIWVDVGGGTGYNIERMAQYVDVPTFFEKIYLVDLSPSLTAVAIDRFLRLGWKNVEVLCQDAREFRLEEHYDRSHTSAVDSGPHRPELITMSYSLSMIPNYYSVIDSLATILADNGIIGVADFYVQNETEFYSRNYTGGDFNRHCMWISRVFWRTWFEADRVSLEAARRDYLEYRFGTILSFNERCRLFGLRIPYYVWIGCSRADGPSQFRLAQIDAQATESPFISALDLRSKSLEKAREAVTQEIRSKAYEAAVINLSASIPLPASWYQQHHWRLYYDETLEKHRQFRNEYIYAFTWEDAKEDARILDIKSDDVLLAITSAGDNILAYALQRPKRIHAVDLNPNQNHLLELKLAAFTALGHSDVWALFGQGKHSNFRDLLIHRLSPHLSSLAFQFWLDSGPRAFAESGSAHGLYYTGGSRHALNLVRWLAHIFGLKSAIEQLCQAQDLPAQQKIWSRTLKPVLLNRWLSRIVFSNKTWLWRALGVPQAQRQMIEQDHVHKSAARSSADELAISDNSASSQEDVTAEVAGAVQKDAIWNYCIETLNPVALCSHLRTSNHYYLLALLGHYTRESHPEYLSADAHTILSESGALDSLRIHTDELREVLGRVSPGTLTIAVVMDSLDWFDPSQRTSREAAHVQIGLLRRSLVEGGRVLLRSAGVHPWYIELFGAHGFVARRVAVRGGGNCMDRVNMYASTWVCTKRSKSRTSRTSSNSESAKIKPCTRPHKSTEAKSLEPLSIGNPTIEFE